MKETGELKNLPDEEAERLIREGLAAATLRSKPVNPPKSPSPGRSQ